MDQKRQTVLQFCPCSQRCASGSQPSPTGALPVQSVVYIPPAHSHLQPELCLCSLWCIYLRLTAISNRVRAVCGVYTSGSQPSPTGALSVQSVVYIPPAHSHLQLELCLYSQLFDRWLSSHRADRRVSMQSSSTRVSCRWLGELRLTAISKRSSVWLTATTDGPHLTDSLEL